MSQAKPYTIYLEVKQPDGRLAVCAMRAIPTGLSDINLASLLIQLENSLERSLHTAKLGVQDSLLYSPPKELGASWKG